MIHRNFIETNIVHHARKAYSFIVVACVAAFMACGGTEQAHNQTAPSNDSSTTSSITSTIKEAVQGENQFEGTIDMKMDLPSGKAAAMTYFMKDKHSRIEANMGDTSEGQAIMLWDLDAEKMTTLIPAKKMYITMDLKEMGKGMREMGEKSKEASGDKEDVTFPKLTKTGKQETIAGHTCEHWLIGDKQEVDVCMAKGLGYFGMGSQFGGGGFGAWKVLAANPKLLAAAATHPEWVQFFNGGAFPLKLTMTKEGSPPVNMEVTKIEKKPLDNSLFTIPSDYKELNMPDMFKQHP